MSLKRLYLIDEPRSIFKKHWVAEVDELPRCDICKKLIKDGEECYYCEQSKVFYCLTCIHDHPKSFQAHSDFRCFIKLVGVETTDVIIDDEKTRKTWEEI